MMIAVFYATIAYSAVRRPRRTPYTTCGAIFSDHIVGFLEMFFGGNDWGVAGGGK